MPAHPSFFINPVNKNGKEETNVYDADEDIFVINLSLAKSELHQQKIIFPPKIYGAYDDNYKENLSIEILNTEKEKFIEINDTSPYKLVIKNKCLNFGAYDLNLEIEFEPNIYKNFKYIFKKDCHLKKSVSLNVFSIAVLKKQNRTQEGGDLIKNNILNKKYADTQINQTHSSFFVSILNFDMFPVKYKVWVHSDFEFLEKSFVYKINESNLFTVDYPCAKLGKRIYNVSLIFDENFQFPEYKFRALKFCSEIDSSEEINFLSSNKFAFFFFFSLLLALVIVSYSSLNLHERVKKGRQLLSEPNVLVLKILYDIKSKNKRK